MHRAQMAFRLDTFQRRFPPAAKRGDGLRVVDLHAFLEAMPRQRAIHRARVHVNVAERLGHELRVRALAARARAVNGDYNWICLLYTSPSPRDRQKSRMP